MKSNQVKAFLRSGYYLWNALAFRSLVFIARKVFRKRVILFCRPAGIGDIICSFPAVLALRELHPDAIIIFGVVWHFREVVQMAHVADYIVGCEALDSFPKFVREDFDFYYLPRLADESGRPQDSVHLVEDYCKLVGVTPKSRQPRLTVPEPIRMQAKETLRPLRAKVKFVIGIHPGTSWPVREWNDEGWGKLVALLHQRIECAVLQLGTDVRGSARIPATEDCVGRFKLMEVAGIIEQLDLFIGIDSGLLHIAGALGTPSVALFGAVDPAKRLGCESPSIAITSDVPCLGCHHREPRLHWEQNCPHEIICMKKILPESVCDAAMKFLAPAEPVPLRAG